MINNLLLATSTLLTLSNLGIASYLLMKHKKMKKPKFYGIIYNKNTKKTMKVVDISNETTSFETNIKGKERKYNIYHDKFIEIPNLNCKILVYLVENIDPINLSNLQEMDFNSDMYNSIIHSSLVKQMTDAQKSFDINPKMLLYGGIAVAVIVIIITSGGL